MGTFDAGTLKGQNGGPDTELTYRTTIHGPVVAYATSNGVKVALSLARSTRGRELLGALAFQKLSTGAVHTPQQFFDTMAGFELTFNWFYADSKHIAMYSSGRLPLRAADVDPGLADERRRVARVDAAGCGGCAPARRRSGERARSSTGTTSLPPGSARPTTTSPTARCTASRCCWRRVGAIKLHTPASVVSCDERRGDGGSARRARRAARAGDARRRRAERARRAAPVDAAARGAGAASTRISTGRSTRRPPRSWTRGGRGSRSRCLQTQLGPLTSDLQALAPISNDANSGGSSYGSGWYSYVEEAVRAAHRTGLADAPYGAHLR